MENKRMTAVEYLEKTINHMLYNGGDLGEDAPALMIHIQKAKAMEKEQIESSFDSGYFNSEVLFYDNAEQYYNETYG